MTYFDFRILASHLIDNLESDAIFQCIVIVASFLRLQMRPLGEKRI